MPPDSYQIRSCPSCGLRYPLTDRHTFGTRCPACLGETRVLPRRKLVTEPTRDLPQTFHRAGAQSAKNIGKDESVALPKVSKGGMSLAVLVDNIRSAWNVGSMFRTADGFGFAHAYLCGITPTPDGQACEAVTKTSLGAEDSVTWSYHKDAVKLVKGLKKAGWKVWALEEDERAVSITDEGSGMKARIEQSRNDESRRQKAVLIVGNEVTGVDPELLNLCDEIFYIPMRGEKKSFNVAVAFGIAAYALR